MSSTLPTRVFMNGNSQAVRIPQEFRLDTNTVEISQNAQGELIIRPIREERGTAFLKALKHFDDTFVDEYIAELEEARQNEQFPQERDAL